MTHPDYPAPAQHGPAEGFAAPELPTSSPATSASVTPRSATAYT
jgi:hypothetical protein